jgi:hypothetical protein
VAGTETCTRTRTRLYPTCNPCRFQNPWQSLTPAEAEAKIRKEIKKVEDNYVAATQEVLDDPMLGKNEWIHKLVLNILYGMGKGKIHRVFD